MKKMTSKKKLLIIVVVGPIISVIGLMGLSNPKNTSFVPTPRDAIVAFMYSVGLLSSGIAAFVLLLQKSSSRRLKISMLIYVVLLSLLVIGYLASTTLSNKKISKRIEYCDYQKGRSFSAHSSEAYNSCLNYEIN